MFLKEVSFSHLTWSNLYFYALVKSFKWHHVCLNPALDFKSYKKSFHALSTWVLHESNKHFRPLGSGCRVYNVCKMDYTDCNFHVKLFCVCMFDSKWGMLSLKTICSGLLPCSSVPFRKREKLIAVVTNFVCPLRDLVKIIVIFALKNTAMLSLD